MKNRIDAIKDLRRCLDELMLDERSNPAKWVEDFLKNPSEEVISLIELKDAEFLNEIDKNSHKEKRKKEYPDMGDQLDAIWKQLIVDRMNGHEMIQEVDDMIGKINAVKAKYPPND